MGGLPSRVPGQSAEVPAHPRTGAALVLPVRDAGVPDQPPAQAPQGIEPVGNNGSARNADGDLTPA
ncbi:hypothetical protein GCM10017750_45400 [Streptomyces racemochromogenes]